MLRFIDEKKSSLCIENEQLKKDNTHLQTKLEEMNIDENKIENLEYQLTDKENKITSLETRLLKRTADYESETRQNASLIQVFEEELFSLSGENLLAKNLMKSIYKQFSHICVPCVRNYWEHSPDKDDLCSIEDNILSGSISVSFCEKGWISKIGILWENYVVQFQTKIDKTVSGWIIRAKDLDHYVMLQCSKSNIGTLPRHSSLRRNGWGEEEDYIRQRFVENIEEGEWYNVRIEVKGFHVKVILTDSRGGIPSFCGYDKYLPFFEEYELDRGRIGFRCAHNGDVEKAVFREVIVSVIDTVETIGNFELNTDFDHTVGVEVPSKFIILNLPEHPKLTITGAFFKPDDSFPAIAHGVKTADDLNAYTDRERNTVLKNWYVPRIGFPKNAQSLPASITVEQEERFSLFIPLRDDFTQDVTKQDELKRLISDKSCGQVIIEFEVDGDEKVLKKKI